MQWRMARIAGFCLVLIGCANQPLQSPIIGKEVQAPFGWYQYCLNNPKDIECKP